MQDMNFCSDTPRLLKRIITLKNFREEYDDKNRGKLMAS
jgi:hypothetical protein